MVVPVIVLEKVAAPEPKTAIVYCVPLYTPNAVVFVQILFVLTNKPLPAPFELYILEAQSATFEHISKAYDGDAVPIPTLPFPFILILSVISPRHCLVSSCDFRFYKTTIISLCAWTGIF